MNASIEIEVQADDANRESNRDLRLDAPRHSTRADASPRIEALQPSSTDEHQPRVKGINESKRDDDGTRRRTRVRRIVILALPILAICAVAPFAWSYLQSFQSTDDAQIDGHIDPLSSRIDGTVIAVHAEDDDRVTKGELLVEIDPRDYEVSVEQAKARMELALSQVAAAKQDYAAAVSNIREGDAEDFRAQRDARRYAALLEQRVVALDQYDQYIANARVSSAKVDSAREAAGSAFKAIAAREADADATRAALDQALLNLSYTKIYAPANGIVGKRGVQIGSRIQPGQTLMFVTETDAIWVTANFKETQVAQMHRDQPVTIRIDTFGRDYRGHVENMPGASGDRFSLLPPENATGNYVKVVQRLPVRIRFDAGQDPEHLLHPGMSVEPTVWLR